MWGAPIWSLVGVAVAGPFRADVDARGRWVLVVEEGAMAGMWSEITSEPTVKHRGRWVVTSETGFDSPAAAVHRVTRVYLDADLRVVHAETDVWKQTTDYLHEVDSTTHRSGTWTRHTPLVDGSLSATLLTEPGEWTWTTTAWPVLVTALDPEFRGEFSLGYPDFDSTPPGWKARKVVVTDDAVEVEGSMTIALGPDRTVVAQAPHPGTYRLVPAERHDDPPPPRGETPLDALTRYLLVGGGHLPARDLDGVVDWAAMAGAMATPDEPVDPGGLRAHLHATWPGSLRVTEQFGRALAAASDLGLDGDHAWIRGHGQADAHHLQRSRGTWWVTGTTRDVPVPLAAPPDPWGVPAPPTTPTDAMEVLVEVMAGKRNPHALDAVVDWAAPAELAGESPDEIAMVRFGMMLTVAGAEPGWYRSGMLLMPTIPVTEDGDRATATLAGKPYGLERRGDRWWIVSF